MFVVKIVACNESCKDTNTGFSTFREILGSESCWQYLLASNAIPGLIQLLTLPWFPESPRYLLIDRGDKEACISGEYAHKNNIVGSECIFFFSERDV